jgi:integrase
LRTFINGKTSDINLNLTIVKNPKTPEERRNKKEYLQIADNLKTEKEAQLIGIEHNTYIIDYSNEDFLGFFKAKSKEVSKSQQANFDVAYKYLKLFVQEYGYLKSGKVPFKLLNKNFSQEFLEFPKTTQSVKSPGVKLSNNSIINYYGKYERILGEAKNEMKLFGSPHVDKKSADRVEAKNIRDKDILTREEARMLESTPITEELEWIKNTFLFALYTGLRQSDIATLEWRHINLGTNRITKTMEKTEITINVELTKSSKKYLGIPGKPNELVFPDYLTYMGRALAEATRNNYLDSWVKKAGIAPDKKIRMHNARHTFAVWALIATGNVFSVMKLLGHKSINSTLKYQHMVDALMNTTVSEIDDFLDDVPKPKAKQRNLKNI